VPRFRVRDEPGLNRPPVEQRLGVLCSRHTEVGAAGIAGFRETG